MFDAIYGAAACTFIETDYVLGVVVADGLQVAELSLAGGFIQKQDVDYFFSFSCNEIYFFATCLLAGEHFIAMLGQIGKYYILNQLVGVVLHGKTEMAIA